MEWIIGSILVVKEVKDNFVYINFVLNLERKFGYFIVNMIIFIFIFSFLNGLVFLLLVDLGECVGYVIMVFLMFVVFFLMVVDNFLKVFEFMFMFCYFLILMLCLSVVFIIVIIFVF